MKGPTSRYCTISGTIEAATHLCNYFNNDAHLGQIRRSPAQAGRGGMSYKKSKKKDCKFGDPTELWISVLEIK